MRTLLFWILFCCIAPNTRAQQMIPFRIQGKFSSVKSSGTIYLYYLVNEKLQKDSCQLIKGVFSFSGKLFHPSPATLSYNNKAKDIFIEPRPMRMLCKDTTLKKIELTGSVSQTVFLEIVNKISGIDNRWKTVFDTLDAVNARSNLLFQELKGWVLQPYFAEIREAYLYFFRQHSNSFVTAYYLSLNIIEANQGNLPTLALQNYYDRFENPVKKSWFGQKIRTLLDKSLIAMPGSEAALFTKTDLNGKPLSLAALRGKYVLLDFWGSWCAPCRKGHPHLKELYSRYQDRGLEIIGIAADNHSKPAWKKAVEQDGLPWPQILIDNLDTLYHITAYPTKILIDKQGTIMGRYGEEQKELNEQLSQIFNNAGNK